MIGVGIEIRPHSGVGDVRKSSRPSRDEGVHVDQPQALALSLPFFGGATLEVIAGGVEGERGGRRVRNPKLRGSRVT